MRTWIYSIPGSGTRFTIRYLADVLGLKPLGVRDLAAASVDAMVYTQHHVMTDTNPNNSAQVLLDAARDGLRVVIPMRSPVATAITREPTHKECTVERVKALWATLEKTIDQLDFVLLPLECPWFDHGRLLRIVARHVGAEPDKAAVADLVRAWPRVGSGGDRPLRTEYDRTGRTTIRGRDSAEFDDATELYLRELALFFSGTYRDQS